jgi:calcineurin-like phosphoesterase family protein
MIEKKWNYMDRKFFFVSDTHFNHANIIRYCNRPFADVQTMNEAMIARWNSVVGAEDIVWHLGDVGFGDRERLKEIVPKLNGRKYLVKGNHDVRSNAFYRECGFLEVYDHPVIIKDFIVLSHEPMPFVMNQMYHNVYGHVHDSPMFKTKGEGSTCVCVERWNYMPVLDKEIFGVSLSSLGHQQPMSYENGNGEAVVHESMKMKDA